MIFSAPNTPDANAVSNTGKAGNVRARFSMDPARALDVSAWVSNQAAPERAPSKPHTPEASKRRNHRAPQPSTTPESRTAATAPSANSVAADPSGHVKSWAKSTINPSWVASSPAMAVCRCPNGCSSMPTTYAGGLTTKPAKQPQTERNPRNLLSTREDGKWPTRQSHIAAMAEYAE